MIARRRGKHSGQRRHAALLPQVANLLDPAELLHVGGPCRDRRGHELWLVGAGFESVRCQ